MDKQIHEKTKEYKVGSGEFITMAMVTKKYLHFQNNCFLVDYKHKRKIDPRLMIKQKELIRQ